MLPKLNVPTFELNLISDDKKINFRPFLVKEEKILLMALESGQEKDILNAMKQILSNCILTEIDIDSLPLFDLQYIFLQLRARSVGEIIEINLKHRDGVNKKGDPCTGTQKIKLNIDEIKPTKNKNFNPKIKLTDDMGIMMKYPTVELLGKIESSKNMSDMFGSMFDIIIGSINYIYHNDDIFYKNDYKKEEISEFLSNLNTDQFEKIKDFFSNMPTISVKKQYVCKKCGVEEELELSSLEDFFS